MFTQNICMVHYCRNLALSSFDKNGKIIEAKGYCLDHIPDPGNAKKSKKMYKLFSHGHTVNRKTDSTTPRSLS